MILQGTYSSMENPSSCSASFQGWHSNQKQTASFTVGSAALAKKGQNRPKSADRGLGRAHSRLWCPYTEDAGRHRQSAHKYFDVIVTEAISVSTVWPKGKIAHIAALHAQDLAAEVQGQLEGTSIYLVGMMGRCAALTHHHPLHERCRIRSCAPWDSRLQALTWTYQHFACHTCAFSGVRQQVSVAEHSIPLSLQSNPKRQAFSEACAVHAVGRAL